MNIFYWLLLDIEAVLLFPNCRRVCCWCLHLYPISDLTNSQLTLVSHFLMTDDRLDQGNNTEPSPSISSRRRQPTLHPRPQQRNSGMGYSDTRLGRVVAGRGDDKAVKAAGGGKSFPNICPPCAVTQDRRGTGSIRTDAADI